MDTASAVKNVGVIGAGRMGQPIIGHMARRGLNVVAYDVDEGKRGAVEKLGAAWVDTPAALADRAEAILVCVGYDRELRELMDGLLGVLRRGTIVAVCSTVHPRTVRELSAAVKPYGVDLVDIPDAPRASARMSALAAAVLVQQQAGVETILHYACRDRNLLAMQSDLLGAHSMGVRNLLLITGDPPQVGDYPDATVVGEVDSIGLTNVVTRLNGLPTQGKQRSWGSAMPSITPPWSKKPSPSCAATSRPTGSSASTMSSPTFGRRSIGRAATEHPISLSVCSSSVPEPPARLMSARTFDRTPGSAAASDRSCLTDDSRSRSASETVPSPVPKYRIRSWLTVSRTPPGLQSTRPLVASAVMPATTSLASASRTSSGSGHPGASATSPGTTPSTAVPSASCPTAAKTATASRSSCTGGSTPT